MLDWLRNLLGTSRDQRHNVRAIASELGSMRARYESSLTTEENRGLWGLTDYLSPKAANSFDVRRTLKIRSRHEAANNSYFRGIVNTMAADQIGTGPRLQCRSKNRGANKQIEKAWKAWARAVGLADKLRTMAKAKIVDGEAFALLVNNRELARTWKRTQGLKPADANVQVDVNDAVQLDVLPIESDQVTTPNPGFQDLFWVDGMTLSPLGIPTEYHVLRMHPGDLYFPQLNPLLYDKWPPRHVCHWFRKDRPGQVRGVPEITPALDLFAQLRRYTKAVVAAAETAADIAWVIRTQMPANFEGPEPKAFEPINTKRGMGMTLPWGADINQLKAEQPTTTYDSFVRVLLREICRCLGIPLCIAMGDSASYNFASGKLDHLPYWRQMAVEHSICVEQVLDLIFAAWFEEAVMIPGLLPAGITLEALNHAWFWDAAESIDPIKDAKAIQAQLETNTTTLRDEWAERGEDWEEALEQRGREKELLKTLGLSEAEAKPAGPASAGKPKKMVPSGT